jgi:catechol 2,3-dioxygenase-like lactoylglutathione lyase family enzyme
MIKTYGLTHVALAVKDAKRSFAFYRDVFGVIKVYEKGGFIQAQTANRGSRTAAFLIVRAPQGL